MPFTAIWPAIRNSGFALGALVLLAGAALGLAVGADQAAAQDGARAVAISVGWERACALYETGTVEC